MVHYLDWNWHLPTPDSSCGLYNNTRHMLNDGHQDEEGWGLGVPKQIETDSDCCPNVYAALLSGCTIIPHQTLPPPATSSITSFNDHLTSRCLKIVRRHQTRAALCWGVVRRPDNHQATSYLAVYPTHYDIQLSFSISQTDRAVHHSHWNNFDVIIFRMRCNI